MHGAALMVQTILFHLYIKKQFCDLFLISLEFNRISVEVLSVVAVQVKSILDAIKAKKKRFMFMDEEINLIPSIGMFITMNPGTHLHGKRVLIKVKHFFCFT